MTLEELEKAIRTASRRKLLLCRPDMALQVQETIDRYEMQDTYKVLASPYVPDGVIYVVDTGTGTEIFG